MGRPRTGSYRLGDMVGLDVVGHVVSNLQKTLSKDPSAPNFDPMYDLMVVPSMMQKMFEKGMLGDKTGQGFYKKVRGGDSKVLALDLTTLEYRDRIEKPQFDELKTAAKAPSLERKIHAALRAEGRGGEFLRKVYLPLFNYAAALVGTICESPKQIDDAMCWGYGWEAGPFAQMDAAGVAWVIEAMKAAGLEPAQSLVDLVAKQGEKASWYGGEKAAPTQWVPGKGAAPVAVPEGVLLLDRLAAAGKEVEKNSSAAIVDLGDGIACFEFRSKANFLDEGVVTLLSRAPEILVEKGFRGLVIGNQAEHFCRGANLMQIAGWIMQKDWAGLEKGVKALQDTLMNLRHGPVPVVAAPFGQTLGGGVEVSLHAAEIQAGADLFMGLVEVAVGVLPAGGGLKEIVRRASQWASQVPDGDPYPWIRRGFEAAATAKVSMSAHEARAMGFLSASDGISFHRSRVIADAKKRAVALAERGWVPPDRNEAIKVIGAPHGASLMMGTQMFEWSGHASEHDKKIGRKIVHVLSGGMTPTATTTTAQHLLDLEREAFVSLCGEAKTFARIQHMLETRKPLRN
jgi:3-hydroxyacyl-CoA dehydrogenase